MRLHFEVHGNGPPLFILHGLFGSLENWRTMARRFSTKFQVYSIDQRNHGQSPHSAEMTYELMAEDLAELVRATKLQRVNVLGHSMGGKTAMQFALSHPEAVERLVVVDIAPKLYPPYHREIIEALLAVDISKVRNRTDLDAALAGRIPEAGVRRFLVKDAKEKDGSFHWQMNVHGIARGYDNLALPPSGETPFTGPTLFLRGEKSDYVTDEDGAGIRRLFPNARIETVLGASHWVHVEKPEPFFRIVRDFLLEGKTAGEGVE